MAGPSSVLAPFYALHIPSPVLPMERVCLHRQMLSPDRVSPLLSLSCDFSPFVKDFLYGLALPHKASLKSMRPMSPNWAPHQHQEYVACCGSRDLDGPFPDAMFCAQHQKCLVSGGLHPTPGESPSRNAPHWAPCYYIEMHTPLVPAHSCAELACQRIAGIVRCWPAQSSIASQLLRERVMHKQTLPPRLWSQQLWLWSRRAMPCA